MNHYTKFGIHSPLKVPLWMYGPEICDMDEGIVERSEDAGDTEDEFT